MNLQQAKSLKQGQMVYHVSKKNADGTPMRARVTSIKTWKSKKNIGRVEVRVKRGLYEYATFNENELEEISVNES